MGAPATRRRVRVRVTGTVQGVGFRPHVHRLAGELGLAGFVLNDERGVLCEAEGESAAVTAFVERLATDAPPLAVVEEVLAKEAAPTGEEGFAIASSERAGEPAGARVPRRGHLRALPGGAPRPRGPPPPLPLHQLHRLRPALHDRARGAV